MIADSNCRFLSALETSQVQHNSMMHSKKHELIFFGNIAGENVHQNSRKKKFLQSDLLMLPACTIGLWCRPMYTEFDCVTLLAML